MPDMDSLEVIAYLQFKADSLGSQKKLAQIIGISPSYLNDLLHFRREPGPKVLDYLGLQKIVIYVDKDEMYSLEGGKI